VREAIRRHGAALHEVLVENGASPKFAALERFARDNNVPVVRRVDRAELDRQSRGVVHQGTLARAPELALTDLSALLDEPNLLILALDSLQDPQNFGAVVRSAVAFGGATLLWGEHGSAPLTPSTFRASAGAIEHARLCRVPSLVGALNQLRERGVTVVGLDAAAPVRLSSLPLEGPLVLVLGSEGEGLAKATRRACSTLATLGELRHVDSLNASVAAGIALYEVSRQRVNPSS
jgi:23S rRNA (guanosine2251-2'-O)-methyltransferase